MAVDVARVEKRRHMATYEIATCHIVYSCARVFECACVRVGARVCKCVCVINEKAPC